MLVQRDPILHNYHEKFVALAARHAIPAVYPVRDFAAVGGLMSYGTVLADAYRQLGIYTGKTLSGAKPSDLPIQQSVKVELTRSRQQIWSVTSSSEVDVRLACDTSRDRSPT
jgi:putative ABC transport system substrate-binding protein